MTHKSTRALTAGALASSLFFTGLAAWLQYRNEAGRRAARFDRAVAKVVSNLDGKSRQVASILDAMNVLESIGGSTRLEAWPRLASSLMPAAAEGGVAWAGFADLEKGEPVLLRWAGFEGTEIQPILSAPDWRALLEMAATSRNKTIRGVLDRQRIGVVRELSRNGDVPRMAVAEIRVERHLAGIVGDLVLEPSPGLRVRAFEEAGGKRRFIYGSDGSVLDPAAQPRFLRTVNLSFHRGAGGIEIATTPDFDTWNDLAGTRFTLLFGALASLLLAATVRSATRKSEVDSLRIRTAVDSLSSPVCVAGSNGEAAYVNPAFVRMFGEPGPPCPLAHVADQRVAAQVMGAVKERRPLAVEIRARTLDGRSRDLLLRVHDIADANGKSLGWIADFTDISERKQIEQAIVAARDSAIEASRLKSAFLANMSHEIRTPLNGVKGMLKLLDMTDLDAEQREYVALAEGSAESLLAAINDILDFSKIEAGKMDLELSVFDLPDMLNQVGRVMGLPAKSKGTRVTVEIGPDVPSKFNGDSKRLRQVVLNLMSNAVKFTGNGNVNLKAMVRNERLRIEVTDTGIGIPSEAIGRLFTPFMQADQSMSRRFGGTGLGLAISRELVELMGGQIGVDSEPGKGSTFWFEIPGHESRPEKVSFAVAS